MGTSRLLTQGAERGYGTVTEAQLLNFYARVCSTGGRRKKPRLWNIQSVGLVPPYLRLTGQIYPCVTRIAKCLDVGGLE